ncbi:MAG: hypothetical protein AB7U95_37745 [Reyranella sp.]
MSLWTDPRIRTLFSNKLLENLRAAHVWETGFNRNYLGEIKGKGSTVKIFSFGTDPTINSYTVPSSALSSQLITYQRIKPTGQELTIDQDKDWAIAEDEIEEMLTNPDSFDALAQNAGWAATDIIDRHLATVINASATSAGITGSGTNSAPIVGHGASDDATAYGIVERMLEAMKNNSVPGMDIHIYFPNWFMTMLRLDLRMSGFNTDNARKTARGEEIHELAGFTLHETINSLDGAGTAFKTQPDSNSQNRIYAVWRGAATYAPFMEPGSMTNIIPAEQNVLSHDNLMRSRFLWGAKVTDARGVLYQVVQRGSYEP